MAPLCVNRWCFRGCIEPAPDCRPGSPVWPRRGAVVSRQRRTGAVSGIALLPCGHPSPIRIRSPMSTRLTGTRMATSCDDASTAAAVQDAFCGSIAITTRSGVCDIAGTKVVSSLRFRDGKRGGHTNFRVVEAAFGGEVVGAILGSCLLSARHHQGAAGGGRVGCWWGEVGGGDGAGREEEARAGVGGVGAPGWGGHDEGAVGELAVAAAARPAPECLQ